MAHVGVVLDLENTIEKDFALFICNIFPHFWLPLIRRCSYYSDSVKITLSSAYLILLKTLHVIYSLIIISVYKVNKCGEATQPCRTDVIFTFHCSCLIPIDKD